MMKVRRIGYRAPILLFGICYSVLGVGVTIHDALLRRPLNFSIGFLFGPLSLDWITFWSVASGPSIAWSCLGAIVAHFASGVLSGAVVVFVYNIVSRYFRFARIRGVVETEAAPQANCAEAGK